MADREGDAIKVRGKVPDGANVLTPGHPVAILGPWTSVSPSGTARAWITAVRGTMRFPRSASIFSVEDRHTVTVRSSISTLATQLIFHPGRLCRHASARAAVPGARTSYRGGVVR